MTVIEFTPGLKPVLKHGAAPDSLKKITLLKHAQHDQSSHGRKGSNGTPLAQDAAGGMVTSESAWDSVLTDEARILAGVSETRALYPERYTPGRGRIINLKPGEIETRVVQFNDDLTLAAGIPPRVQDYQGFADAGLTQQESYNVKGGVETMDSRLVPVGPARPPQHVYRVMAVGEFDQARERGYIKTDERMNLGSDEGTVTSLRSTGSFYQPVDGSDYRVVRIKYDDADGWLRDRDSYIKTPERVPFERVDAFSPVVAGSGAVAKHGTHDQSDHGRRGSGSSTGKALDPTNADDVRKAFTGTIETRAGTVNVVVDSVDVFDFSTTVQGALIGPGGEYHGRWHRTITPEIKVMYNESFEVAEGSRKSGIGTEFQKHSERAALALGMEKINIKAADDGREAWATERFGFDFAGPPSEGLARAKAVASKMKSSATVAKITDLQSRFEGPQENWPKPHEILALKGDPALRFFMGDRNLGQQILSYGWDGRKPADRVTKQTEPKMFYVTVESDYADVAKHGTGDQSPHGRRGGGSDAPISPERVAEAFNGTYHTHTGLEFTLVANDAHYADGSGGDGGGRDGGNIRVQGEILVGDQVVGKWVRDVSGTTMIAESLNVGKDFGGNALPDAEKYQGQGIALEVQKQTEKAARNLGCTEIKVSAMNDGVAAWAQERFGYRFELKPDLRGNSKPGREPRTEEELAIPKGGMAYVQGARQYRGEDGLLLGVSHPDLGIPSVRNALAGIEERFKSRNADDWPTPAEVVSLGTGRRVSDDIIQGKTLGEFLLSRGWSGIKSSDHVTKAAGGYMRVVVEGEKGAVEKHGTGDQSPHGRRARDVTATSTERVLAAWKGLTLEADPYWNGPPDLHGGPGAIKAHVVKAVSARMSSTTAEIVDAVYNNDFRPGGSVRGEQARGALSTATAEERAAIDGYSAVERGEVNGQLRLVTPIEMVSRIKYGQPFALVNTPEADKLIRDSALSEIVAEWAAGSNGTPASFAVQTTAKRVFGLDESADWQSASQQDPGKIERLTYGQNNRKVLEDYVEATYEETQAVWKKQGIKSVTLYRGIRDSNYSIRTRPGMSGDAGVNMDVTMRPLTSWAYTITGAKDFAGERGVVFKAVVPIEKVWSTALTGAGCYFEDEFIILGGNIPTVAYNQGNTKAVESMINDDETVDKATKGDPFNIDENPMDADWIKTLSWDLPTTPEGMEAFFGPDWLSIMKPLPAWLAAPESLKSPAVSGMVSFAPGLKPMLKHGTHDQSDHGNWARDTAEPDPQQVRDAWTELSELASPNTFGFEAGKIKAFVSRAVSDRMTSSVAEIVEVVYSRDVRSSVRQEEALRNARAALSTASPEVRALSPRISHVTTNTQGRLEWTYGGEPPDGSVRVHTPEADAMIKRAAVSAMIKEWSIGSNDSNLGLAIQDTAKRVFDLPDASEWDDPYTIKPDVGVGRLVNGEVSRKVLEDYVSATYETTQAMWKKMGIKSVALYRGIDDTKDQFKSRPEMQANGIMRTPVKMRPLTSWAFTEKGAQMFAGSRGVIFKAVVPIENVWSTALTGAGCHNEDEFIVLGGNIPTVAVQMSPKIDSDGGYTPHVDWDTVNKAKTVAYNIDASPMDADWIKTLSWDLPDTADEMEAFLGPDWRSIMEPLPAWLAAPESLKSGAVAKHGIHDQSRHGNWAHGRGTGSHAGEAKIGPASATDGYGNARGATYVSGNRGETETPLPEGWFRATEKEHDAYDRAAMRYMLPIRLEDGLEPGSALEDNYLRSYKSTDAAKVQLFAGPNGTGVVVQGQISWRDDFTPEDFVQNLKQLSELQRVTPTPGLQVIVSTQTFRKLNLDESTMGFVDTRDNDTINLRPSALSAGNKYDGSWFSVMSVPETDRPKYALTHEYGHVIDRRTDESSLADFQTVVNSGRLTTGSSSYAREGYFAEGAGGRGLQVGDKPTGREMFAEAYAGWVFSKGWSARDPGMVQFFAEKYGWDSETGTAPMAKAKSKGRIYMDSFGPEGGWVLDSLPEESVTVAFAPGLKPVLKHGTGDQSPHGRRGGGGAGAGSQDGSPDDVAESDSYRMSHQPDISGPSISDVENLYPGIYENPEWYSTGDPKSDLESLAVIKKVRGNPDAMVTVYRAVPQGATTINPGDWVSLSRTYATEHGMHTTDPAQDMPVISMEVPARFVVEGSGNSINEWGYNPDSNVAKHGTGDQSPHGRRGSDGGQSSPSGQDEQSFDSWRDVPFDAGDMADINYLIEETDPPATLYHVAPKTARQDIVENGLDASGQTWNTGASEGWNEGEFNWTESDDGEKFAYEYRPTGVYMFADLGEARKYNRDGKGDIYEIDTAANDREIIRDPSQASNWEYVDEPDRAFVTRYVEPSALRVVEEPMSKHGTHDQKNHGRRYSGKVDPAVAEKAIRLVGEYGGLSIKMTDGSEPPDGYMVARNSKKFGIAVTADEFFGPRGAEHLATMVLQNRAVLGSGRAYLGVWHQTEITHEDGSKTPLARKDQVVHLDVTDRIVERSRAVSLGRRRDQISIWDVIETEEIKTGGKGADVQKRDRRGNPEAAIEDDGRRRSGVGEGGPRAVGQTGCRAVAVVKFSPGLVPVLKHGTTHNEVDHGRRGGGAGGAGAGSQDGGVTPVVNDFTDSDGNLTQPRSLRDPNHPDEEITVIPARANPMDGLNVVSIYKGGEQAGVMRYEPYSGKVEWINVEEKFRRQGVATRLWKAGKYVAAKHPNMVEPKHSESQTTEGAAWATVAKFYRSLGPILKHGTHDQMMQPPVVFKFVPGLVPVLKHGDPSRPGYAALHPNSGHASVRSGVTATGAGERMADLPEPARAKVQAWCDSNNVDIDAIADDMFRAFDVPEAVRQGGRWYKAEFQHHAILMAERQGISVEESTAAIAITSARTRWAAEDGTLVNVRTAERFYEDQKAGRYDGMTAEQAARAVPNGYLMGNGFGQNVIAMMKGEISIDEAVTGAKRRSFFNNGMFPEHDTSATMDVWMGHYMARQSGMPILRVQNALSAKAPAYLKDAGHDMSPAYFVLREATLRAHDRAMAGGRVAEDWLPLQSQATMWVAISQGYLGAVEGVDE